MQPLKLHCLSFRAFRGFVLRGCLLLLLSAAPAQAHQAPSSFVDLRMTEAGIDLTVQASATDLAHDLPTVEPGMLMTPAVAAQQENALARILLSRLTITADGRPLTGQVRGIEPIPDRQDVRLRFLFPAAKEPRTLAVHAALFPYDPRHKTFLSIFQDGALAQQSVLDKDAPDISFHAGRRQGIASVIKEFVFEGIHHIFLGPDHILFIVGLLFLGGTLKQLLKIVTAFTVAHSITLALATLNIVNPPARLIEPAIALSIVFVGVHSLTYRGKSDPSILFAFCFGFIHGFGFANALHEMALPQWALGWSLLSFNVGVEIGQMCIVLAVAPLLALLRDRRPQIGRQVVRVGSLGVIFAGGFWFIQRAFFGG